MAKGPAGYVIDGRLNDAFKAMNLLFDKNVPMRRADAAGDGVRPGDFLVAASAPDAVVADIARQTGVDFSPLKAEPKQAHDLKRLRIGMYQRYRGGNMDEGWTRWLFEAQFMFPFKSVYDAEIKKGNLNANYDVFIFADDTSGTITGEPAAGGGRGGGGGGRGGFAAIPDSTPPEYRSGIGTDGVNAIRDFVAKGGTLVTLGGATDFAITRLGLPVRNVVAGLSTKEFFCPGSTLRVKVDNTNPLAYGMPRGCPGAVPLQPGLRRGGDRLQRQEPDHRSLCRSQRRAERLAERGEVHCRQDGHGVDRVRAGKSDPHRIPDPEPRPDPRHVQVPVQRLSPLV